VRLCAAVRGVHCKRLMLPQKYSLTTQKTVTAPQTGGILSTI
jgi:hypothetical protein